MIWVPTLLMEAKQRVVNGFRAHLPVLLAFVIGSGVFLPAALVAQAARVTVSVVSGSDPVEGVEVTVGSLGVLTDENGEAVLRLPTGEHSIVASRIGFADSRVSVVLTALRDTAVVIELEEEAVETEGIIVASTRTDRRIEEEPMRVEVVNREEVEEKLLMTPGDIAMLLNETAGLRVQPTAPSLGGASVRIQGLRGRYTQILSDGLPLYGGQAGALGPLQVPPMDLAQVEVIKGAASALYGSTALGGVVNLISRRPANERELLVNESSLDGTDIVGWMSDDMNEDWGYTLLTSVHRQGFIDVDTDGWADLPRFRRAVARPRFFWNNQEGGSAMFTMGGMVEERAGGTLPGSLTPAGAVFREGLDTRRLDGGFVGRLLTSDTRSISARASASVQGHDHEFGSRLERDTHKTGFAELAMSGQDADHLWVVGAAFQYDGYDAQDVQGFDFDYAVPALFAQDEYAPVDWLAIAASARLDQHSEYGTRVSPRVSLLVRPGEWVMRLSAGTGYFAPTPFTEETEAVGLNRLVPNTGLGVERAKSAMIDVGRVFGSLEVNVSAFGSEIDDPLVTRRMGETLVLENSAEPVRTWGTEVLARVRHGPLRLIATHAYLRSTELDLYSPGRREVPLTPRHSAGLVAAWEVEDVGRAGLEFYFTGRQELDDNPYRDVSKSYAVVGFLVDRRFGRYRLFFNAENILDTRQTGFDSLVRPSQTLDGRWITDVWAPLDGRSFNGGVWITF